MPETFDFRNLPLADEANVAALKKSCGIGSPVAPKVASEAVSARAAANKASGGIKPGKERWPVKTGTDPDVTKIKKTVVPVTVEELRSVKRPATMADPTKEFPDFQNKRAVPAETTIWQVDCTITAIKLEQDGDYHLVLQGTSGDTMIGEIPTPDPPFVAATSPFVAGIRKSRAAIDKKFGAEIAKTRFLPAARLDKPRQVIHMPVSAFSSVSSDNTSVSFAETAGSPFKMSVKPARVRLTGVGFFDRKHDQTGVAPNGIELHPVIDVQFL